MERFVVAPDAVSEVRAVVGEVIAAIRDGVPLHKIPVLYNGDPTYRSLIPQTFDAAGIPAASLPGTPLNETPVDRGVLAPARLPLTGYSPAALFDFLALARCASGCQHSAA